MTFSADVAQFAKKANVATDKTVRAITFALFSGVIKSSPVDTGRFRGNWQTTTGSPASGTVTQDDKSGAATIAQAQAKLGGLGSVTYLTNNLPYAERLEYDGWSGQAPQGMVRINVARIDSIVSAAARASKV